MRVRLWISVNLMTLTKNGYHAGAFKIGFLFEDTRATRHIRIGACFCRGRRTAVLGSCYYKAGGWDIFSTRDLKNAMEAMDLYWLAATALRVWENVGASKREWIVTGRGHRFPVTGIV